MYRWLVLGQLSVKVAFERIAVMLGERNWGSYVQVVEKVSDMEKD